MGSRGTMIVDMESEVLLYPEAGTTSRKSAWTVTQGGGGKPAVQASGSTAPAAAAAALKSNAPVSKGYREEWKISLIASACGIRETKTSTAAALPWQSRHGRRHHCLDLE